MEKVETGNGIQASQKSQQNIRKSTETPEQSRNGISSIFRQWIDFGNI